MSSLEERRQRRQEERDEQKVREVFARRFKDRPEFDLAKILADSR